MRRLFGVGVLLLVLSGCSGNSSTAPTSATINMSGTWTGNLADSIGASGALRFTLVQSGSIVTGSFAAGTNGGSFNGAISGTALSGTTTPSVPTQCPATVAATVAGTTMTGTTATFNCTAAVTSTFTVIKQ